MNCIVCNCSITERPLFRTKPMGQPDAGWTCMPCMEKTQPELAANEKEEGGELMKDLTDIFYPQTPKV